MRTHVKPCTCTLHDCTKSFATKRDLERHKNVHHSQHKLWKRTEKPKGPAIEQPSDTTQLLSISRQELLPTDSGYSSKINYQDLPIRRLECLDKELPVFPSDREAEEAKTTYSAETSSVQGARYYISELSSDIFGKLRRHVCSEDWAALLQVLPELIKAFALKLAHESAAQINLSIMYLIHKRHL